MALPFFGRKRKEEKSMPAEMPSLSSLDQITPLAEPHMIQQPTQSMQHIMPQQLPPLPAIPQTQFQPLPARQQPEPKAERMPERPTAAPLFVKVDRYRHVLSTIASLKSSLSTIKSSLAALDQIDKLKGDAVDVISQMVSKLDQKLAVLDSDLLRPAGYHDTGEASEYSDVRGIEATVSDLQGQIEQLRSELNRAV